MIFIFIIYHKQKKSKSLINFKSFQYPNSIQYEKCSVLAGLKVFPELVLVMISFKESKWNDVLQN